MAYIKQIFIEYQRSLFQKAKLRAQDILGTKKKDLIIRLPLT